MLDSPNGLRVILVGFFDVKEVGPVVYGYEELSIKVDEVEGWIASKRRKTAAYHLSGNWNVFVIQFGLDHSKLLCMCVPKGRESDGGLVAVHKCL